MGGRIDEIDEDCLSAVSVGSVGFLVLTSFFFDTQKGQQCIGVWPDTRMQLEAED